MVYGVNELRKMDNDKLIDAFELQVAECSRKNGVKVSKTAIDNKNKIYKEISIRLSK